MKKVHFYSQVSTPRGFVWPYCRRYNPEDSFLCMSSDIRKITCLICLSHMKVDLSSAIRARARQAARA